MYEDKVNAGKPYTGCGLFSTGCKPCPNGLQWMYMTESHSWGKADKDEVKVQPYRAGNCPEELFVQLTGGARTRHSSLAGTYMIHEDQEGGFPYWVSGKHCMWYNRANNQWLIGKKKDRGTDTGGLRSTTMEICPTELDWEYINGKKWIIANDDIKVQSYMHVAAEVASTVGNVTQTNNWSDQLDHVSNMANWSDEEPQQQPLVSNQDGWKDIQTEPKMIGAESSDGNSVEKGV